MSMKQQIETKLRAAFQPVELEILDESDRHKGHSGYREGGETHFSVRIVSSAFEGMSRLQRQRAVYKVLEQELATRIHALSLQTVVPTT